MSDTPRDASSILSEVERLANQARHVIENAHFQSLLSQHNDEYRAAVPTDADAAPTQAEMDAMAEASDEVRFQNAVGYVRGLARLAMQRSARESESQLFQSARSLLALADRMSRSGSGGLDPMDMARLQSELTTVQTLLQAQSHTGGGEGSPASPGPRDHAAPVDGATVAPESQGAPIREMTGMRRGPLAQAAHWGEVSIEVLDDNTVRYRVGASQWRRADYTDLGFRDRRRALPNRLWETFRSMARGCEGTFWPVETPRNISKDMDRIRQTLRSAFGLSDIPFKYNRTTRGYDLSFTLRDTRGAASPATPATEEPET